jgi:hypothetical protein
VSTPFSLTGALQRRKVICHVYEFTSVVGFLLREPGRHLLYGTDSKPVKFSLGREYDRRARSSVVDRVDQPRLPALASTNPRKHALSRQRRGTAKHTMSAWLGRTSDRWQPAHRAGSGARPPIDSPVAQGYSIPNGSSLHFGCECSFGFHLQRESASRNCPWYDPPRGSNASIFWQPAAVDRQARLREESRQRSSRLRVRPDSFQR